MIHAAYANWLQAQAEHEVTQAHLRLLPRLQFGWLSYVGDGAPGVVPRRPFGNSDIERDAAEILGIVPEGEEIDRGVRELSLDQRYEVVRLYVETLICLEILIGTCQISPGFYVRSQPGNRWSCVRAPTQDLTARNRAMIRSLDRSIAALKDDPNLPAFLKPR